MTSTMSSTKSAATVIGASRTSSTFPTAVPSGAPVLTHRDRAVLRAVAAGRCRLSSEFHGCLVVDGLCLADQFTGPRLTRAGLITAPATRVGSVELTPSGRALLAAA